MKDLQPILHSLGFLESEIKVYLAGFKHGPGAALDFARSTGLSRQAVYVSIEALTGRGLMSSSLHGKKRFFASEHPEKLLSFAKRREAEMRDKIGDLERMVPDLLLKMGGEKPVMRVFEGKEGVLAVLKEMQDTKAKEMFEIVDMDAFYALMADEDVKYITSEFVKLKSKTKIRSFFSGATKVQTLEGERHQLTESQSNFKSDILIVGNKIALMSLSGKLNAIIIDNEHIAHGLSILFEQGLGKK